jgi:hypothetical protein
MRVQRQQNMKLWFVFVLWVWFPWTAFRIVKADPSSRAAGTAIIATNGHSANENDAGNTGIIQVVESEVWDASSNDWKVNGVAGDSDNGHRRWTNEKGQASPSPAEILAPEGWEFMGDWKIVVNSKNGDPMGWEYEFQYLRPPRRRRIWLRSLQKRTTITTVIPSSPAKQSRTAQVTRATPSSGISSRTTFVQRIRDDWNFKGYGFSIYKSVIETASCGIGIRLPLSVNFDFFDRHPEFPSVTTSIALFFPWTIVGYLSASIHVEWVKWVAKSALGLIPRLVIWLWYKILLPIVWTVLSVIFHPIRDRLPSLPTTIPKGFWTIAQPKYNSEISERIGCSISYRWSKKRGYEWRVSYSHSYLPTLLVYQNFWSETQQRLQSLTRNNSRRRRSMEESLKESSSTDIPSSSFGSGSSTTITTANSNNMPIDWWQKHFTRVGISTGYPTPTPPHFSCSAMLSWSGLYFGAGQGAADTNNAAATATTHTTVGVTTSSSGNAINSNHKIMNNSLSDLRGESSPPLPLSKKHDDDDDFNSGMATKTRNNPILSNNNLLANAKAESVLSK